VIVTLCSFLVLTSLSTPQQLPPPGDGDIRVVSWELLNETEVWLTLEPKTPDGKPAPPGMILTFTFRFPGKRPKAPPSEIQVNAYAGTLWAPKVALWFVIDDREKIDLVPPGVFALSTGTVSDYLSGTISISTLKRIANAKRVTGNALGVDFELTESQRQAIRAFLERVLSDDPTQGQVR
jgi:hypothetical protein